ncbi:MAG: oligoendopeptidase F [Lachnospiraceae bacterium]|nr:oligoendopeptidase F [Lachnospiraceae bacterium]
MADKLLKRSEVPVEQTWDLTLLYKNDEEMEKDVKRFIELADKMATYKGKLNNAKAIKEVFELLDEFQVRADWVSNYTNLAVETDHTDAKLAQKNDKIYDELVKCDTKISFIESEISKASNEVLEEAKKISDIGRNTIEKILRNKPHMLSDETEEAMAALSQTFGSGYETYLAAKHADMKFDDFEANGKKYPLGYSLFEDDYEYESDTEVRRAAFAAFHKKLKQYENVTATAYNQCVRQEKTMATLRGFDSVIDSLLFYDNVSRDLYNRQIDLITEKLAPHMRKYARLLKKIHKLDKMTYADLKLTVDPGYAPKVTMEDAKKYCAEGLSILGSEYVEMVEEAFDNRWFDVANNEGKCTGGFCSSPHGKNSFILLSFNGRMSDVFTMAHELGHAGHFRACSKVHSTLDCNPAGYFVEAPSTMNELIMSHHLIKQNDDLRFRRWVLANMVSNTYYHNFVTHLLEAAYQREVYKIMDEGGSVQAETLSGIFKNVLEKFWGEDVELTEGAELTWMRQPHYYMGLYSYTYSAGLTIATEACHRIETEGQKAVDDWKRGLAAGGTLNPLEFAKNAGVDISTDAPLLHTIETIGAYIDEICELTEKLGF